MFQNNGCRISRSDGTRIAVVLLTDSLYRLCILHVDTAATVGEGEGGPVRVVTRAELHRELGHISPETAHGMVAEGLVGGLVLSEADGPVEDCESCVAGKMMRKPIAAV